MSRAPITIAPQAYKSWRATLLGATMEAIEQRLILGMMGDLSGVRVLDAGCGDGALVCAAALQGALVTSIDPDLPC
jgi:2-polyprenyl-3-methyl-5-hydroxy-6-metoxy-1,4-benzoquinol methylase